MPSGILYSLSLTKNIASVTSGLTAAEINSSGFATYSGLHTSGYIRNVNFVSSGFATYSNLYTSGYVRNVDLLGSGYVRTINGLSNAVTLVGSGGATVWVDGQTIQISASGGGGGSGVSLDDVRNDLRTSGYTTLTEVRGDIHTSGYIRNVNFVTSGFITKAEVASSGFATYTGLASSGYTTLNEIKNDIHTSGYIKNTDFVPSGFITKAEVASSGFATYTGLAASGYTTLNEVKNDLHTSGYIRNVNFVQSGFITKSEVASSGFATYAGLANSGYTTLSEVRNDIHTSGYIKNSDFVPSGFITKAEVANSGFATRSELVTSGYTTLNEVKNDLHTSGYIRNVNFVQSGFITKSEVASSGFATYAGLVTSGYTTLGEVRSDIHTSGYIKNADFVPSGFITKSEVASSGFATYAGLAVSGFTTLGEVRGDLHTSGYIKNVDFVQSGFITKGEVASSGFATYAGLLTSGYTTIGEVRNDLHTSGYIRNIDFVSSGFTTATELAGSGYLRAADRMYPVDARAVSGHITVNTSGVWDIGTETMPFNAVYAKSGIYIGSAIVLSGLEIPYRVNGVSGPQITIRPGYGMLPVTTGAHSIYINSSGVDLTGSGFATYTGLATSGYTTLNEVRNDIHTSGYIRNADFVQSGFITKTEVASSGFATYAGLAASGYTTLGEVRSDIHTSGYIRNVDFVSSGYAKESDITASGYLRAIDRMYPVDARAVSGNIIPIDSGTKSLGSLSFPFSATYSNQVRATDIFAGGAKTIYTINSLTGGNIDLVGGTDISITPAPGQITIAYTGTGGPGGGPEPDQYPVDARGVSGHIVPITNQSGYWDIGSNASRFNDMYANDFFASSGVFVSGLPVVVEVNNIPGPELTFVGGTGVQITSDAATKTITIAQKMGIVYVDQPYNNTPLVPISGLSIPVDSGKSYAIEAYIMYTSTATANGIGLAVDLSTGTAAAVGAHAMISTSVTAYTGIPITALNTAALAITSPGTTQGDATIRGFVSGVSANANLLIDVRSELNTGVITVKRGSYFKVTQLN